MGKLGEPLTDEEVEALARKWINATPEQKGSQMWYQSHISDYLGAPGDWQRVDSKIQELKGPQR